MDGATFLGILSLIVAAIALVVSGIVSRRQLTLASNSIALPLILEGFKESRSPEFSASVEYILTLLQQEHPSDGGYRRLPIEARRHVRRVGLFYDDLGKLVAHRVVDERLVLGAYGGNLHTMWQILGPYIYAEAQSHGSHPMPYFENLAARAQTDPRPLIHLELGLRTSPPHEETDT